MRLNSSRVTSPRAWSLPPACKPELACKDTRRWALGGKKPNILNSSEKEIFLKDKAMPPAEKKRSGGAGTQGMKAATISSNDLVLWLLGLRLLDPLLLPGRFGSFLDRSRRSSTAAKAPASGPCPGSFPHWEWGQLAPFPEEKTDEGEDSYHARPPATFPETQPWMLS